MTSLAQMERMAVDLGAGPTPNGRRRRFTKLENELQRNILRGAPDHVLDLLDKARELRGPYEPRGSLNTWSETLYSSTVSETALTAAAEAVVFPTSTVPGWYGFIPGGYMVPHRTLHFRIAGQLSTAATPGTMLWRVRWGGLAGTVLVASGGAGATGTALTMSASQTNAFWRAEVYVTARGDISVTAALLATGIIETNSIPTTFATTFPVTAPAPVNADTSTGKDLSFTHTPSLATASFQGLQYTLESMN
jgi:hypothetical protein